MSSSGFLALMRLWLSIRSKYPDLPIQLPIFRRAETSDDIEIESLCNPPVEELYEGLQWEKAIDPKRMERLVGIHWSLSINGTITNIEGNKVQFHVRDRIVAPDLYVECELSRVQEIQALNKGDRVRGFGCIYEVGDVIRFKDCILLSESR